MTELPSDRVAASGDFDMGDEDDDDDEAFEAEYARVGMPNGVADFSFHTLLDPAACIGMWPVVMMSAHQRMPD